MIKKIYWMLVFAVIFAVSVGITSIAAPRFTEYYVPVDAESELLPAHIKESKVRVNNVTRGFFFAAGELTISNKDGKIGVSAKTYMKKPVDEVYMTIYLDRQVGDKWAEVEHYDFEFFAKDYPNGLIDPGMDFTISGQPTGYYYRLRGQYAAFLDGVMEGFGPVTDGVFIE